MEGSSTLLSESTGAGREGERVNSELELLGQSIGLFLYQPVIQLSSGQKGEETVELS